MKTVTKSALITLCLASTALMPLAALAQAALTQTALANPLAVTFAQDHSDIQPDPAARFGRLPNGMTYVIYKNATPSGTVSVHLRIAAGSLMESDQERGLAHFIEHMAFNGTTHIKTDDLIPMLQRHGIKLGPDAEAYTLPNKTEFMLDLPKNDADSVDTALFVLREFAGNLTFEPAAVERERAVVLGEERLRETPSAISGDHWLEAAFPGQKFATRGNPIGLPDIIRTATPDTLRGYYNAFYRPELATLVVVGDIDPDVIEAKIKAKFGDWTPRGPARPVDFGAYRTKGETTFVEAAKSLPDSLSVTWFRPFDGAAETHRIEDDNITDSLLISALNLRLQHQAQQPDSAFAGATVGQQSIYQTAKVFQLAVAPKPGQDKAALAQALAVVHQFSAKGVPLSEVAPILARLDAFFANNDAGAKTRNSSGIAGNIITNLDGNAVFTSPAQDLADYHRFKAALTQDALDARLKALALADGPLLGHTAEDLAGLDAPALQAGYATAMAAQTSAYAVEATKAWPYTSFGQAQAPVSEKADAAFGDTQYTFANGVRLNVLPTKLKDNQILIQVGFAGGFKTISPKTTAPVDFTGIYAGLGGYFGGGLGKLDMQELQKTLAGKTVGVSYGLSEDRAVLGGSTTPANFATEMQLLMAYTTDAAYRPAVFNQLHGVLPNIYTQVGGSPQAVLQTHIEALTHVDDNRYVFPTLDQAQAVTLDQIKAIIQASIQGRPVEITIVGDIDPKAAIAEVGATFGTLVGLTPPVPVAGGDTAVFPTRDLDQTLYHKGRADQSISLLAWPLPDAVSDVRRSRALQILAEIISERAFVTVREKLGQAYDPNAAVSQSLDVKNYGYLEVSGSVATGQDAAFTQAVTAIVDDLKAHPVSQDELDRARKPVLDRAQTSRKENGYWLGAITTADGDARRTAYYTGEDADLAAVTPAMIQDLAKTYLVSGKALHVKVVPEAAANPPAAAK